MCGGSVREWARDLLVGAAIPTVSGTASGEVKATAQFEGWVFVARAALHHAAIMWHWQRRATDQVLRFSARMTSGWSVKRMVCATDFLLVCVTATTRTTRIRIGNNLRHRARARQEKPWTCVLR